MPSFALPVTHVSGTPVTYVPSLYKRGVRGDLGAGLDISIYSKGLGRRKVIVSGLLFHGTQEFFL